MVRIAFCFKRHHNFLGTRAAGNTSFYCQLLQTKTAAVLPTRVFCLSKDMYLDTAKETSSRLCQMKMRHVRPVKNTNSLSMWRSFHNNMWVLTLCCYSSREIEQECDISLQNSDREPIERYNLVEQQEHSAIVTMQPILRFDKWL